MPTILVIDDEPQMLKMLERVLSMEGYTVLTAPDGKQGLNICRTNPIDLVITDVIMPEVEGLEVVMTLKRMLPAVKIIAISGGGRNQPTDYLFIAGRLGAHRTFVKPLDRKELLSAVKELLE